MKIFLVIYVEEMGRDEINKYEIYTKFTCEKLLET
jgi:hypothetical protein